MADEGGGAGADVAGIAETVISDADADLLIAEAVKRREEQRSGRSMSRQLPLVAGSGTVGLLLIALGGFLGRGAAVAAFVAGVLVIAVAGLALLRALDLSPVTQWGEPIGRPCPACLERGLREDRVAVPEANGIVTLCTPECGYADVTPDPDGSPEGDRRKLWSRLTRPAW